MFASDKEKQIGEHPGATRSDSSGTHIKKMVCNQLDS